MRYIVKTERCAEFEGYIATKKPADWSKFKDNLVKLALHQHLLQEQQYLCIYCQQSIPRKAQVDNPPAIKHPSHIEHIRPKDNARFPHLTFEHTNLSVSCDGFDIEGVRLPAPKFCGHPKDNDYDDTLFLHPFEEPDIELFFEYDINGKIKPSGVNVAKAQHNIELLHLDDPVLETMRVQQYQLIVEETTLNGLDINDYLDPTKPELPKFYSMLKQLFGLL